MSQKEDILAKIKANTLKSEQIYIESWDETLVIRELSGKLYVDISSKSIVNGAIDQETFLNYAIVDSVFSIEGEQIFENGDLETISGLSADVYASIVRIIMKLNNITDNSGASKTKNA